MTQKELTNLMNYSKMMNSVFVPGPEKSTSGQKKGLWSAKCPLKGKCLGLAELNGEEKGGW